MTTDVAAAKFPARFHDYRDLPGDRVLPCADPVSVSRSCSFSAGASISSTASVSAARHHQWGRFIVSPAILWTAMGMLMLLFRTLLWFRYRTPPLATMDERTAADGNHPRIQRRRDGRALDRIGRARTLSARAARGVRRRRRQRRRHLAAHPARRTAISRHRHAAPLRPQPRQARGARSRIPPRVAARSW